MAASIRRMEEVKEFSSSTSSVTALMVPKRPKKPHACSKVSVGSTGDEMSVRCLY